MITWHTEQRKLSDLVEWDKNPRQLSDHDRQHIEISLDKFGLADPLVINLDGQLIGGHQRKKIMLAMEQYGTNVEIDVRVPDRQLTEAEAAELNIRLNKNTGEWDFDVLGAEFKLDDLKEWGFSELELEMEGLTAESEEPVEDPGAQVDKAEELREKYGVELGQLWQLGEHRVVCGDCTDAAVVERMMGGEIVDLLLADPPYGVDWNTDYTRFTTAYGAKRIKHAPIINDDKPFDPAPWLNYPQVILWGANWYCRHIPVGTWLVWDKRHQSGAAFLSDAELAWQKGKRGVYIYAEVVQGAHRKERAMHPTQKPVGLLEWCISRCEDAEIVLDPFLGSGTTLIACERLSRQCRGIEIEPKYVAVTLERWHEMTGLEPQLVSE